MLIAFWGIVGLIIGSFLNVVIWRLPRGEKLSSPPSACPKCGNHIAAYDNIPLVSWLVLRAKCRGCGAPISARYPAVELLTGLVFAGVAWKFDSSVWDLRDMALYLPFLYVAAIGIALAFIDLDTHKLPNKIVLPAYLVLPALLAPATWGSELAWSRMLQALIGCAALYAFYFVLCIIGGMGFGDVKLAGVLGLALGWLGWDYLVVGAFMPFLLGGLFSLGLIAVKKAGRKSGIPFGPWMILGAFIAFAVAAPIANWYLDTFM